MTEPRTPLSEEETRQESARLIETAFRDDTPLPRHGATPPVPQPGRPPMSQKAVDASALMLSGGVATVLVGGSASLVLAASGIADPAVIGICAATPLAVAVPIVAVTRLLKRAKSVLPEEHHHHYNAPVHHQHTHSSTRGVWARTDNRQ
jgi:hypothetical protein